ncbi:MAG: translational GTPase TypA [Candidatus Gottesmanbacteria bacterium]
MDIRNVAIIAHVDHGKTTLVDAMLKQTHTFRENQKEMGEILILDSNDLEKEKGITILSKNTSVVYNPSTGSGSTIKINIIDTPGHADFGGEVERVLNMASGAILLVDAVEGPLPQTKFVLKKALEQKLKIILVINKIDKKDARPQEVIKEVENLFMELAEHESAFDFITLYAVGRDGKAFYELPNHYLPETEGNLGPLFETILKVIPNSSKYDEKPFQMLVSTLDFDNYVGKLCIGKISQGKLKIGNLVALTQDNKITGTYRVQKLYTSVGLERIEAQEVNSGDIIAIAGIPELTIGQTITDPAYPKSLPTIKVEEPIIKISIGPNTSPLSGRDGKFCTSRQIKERLLKEKETNLGLKIEEDPHGANFIVAGRGELHLAILIETMRREGFEMQISKPQVIIKNIDNQTHEPYEEVTIDISKDFLGLLTEEMARRKAEIIDMTTKKADEIRVVYKVSSQNLIGIRTSLLTKTRGTAIISTYLLGYFIQGPRMDIVRNGALIASQSGKSLSYGLANAQERGILFIGPDEDIYEGMVVGITNRDQDIEVNVCKAKKQTNVRSENADIAVILTPPQRLDLEKALDFVGEDEYLEVTPKNIRIRKIYLSVVERRVKNRKASHDIIT